MGIIITKIRELKNKVLLAGGHADILVIPDKLKQDFRKELAFLTDFTISDVSLSSEHKPKFMGMELRFNPYVSDDNLFIMENMFKRETYPTISMLGEHLK